VKTMKDYIRVRQMREIEGLSLREITRQTGWHRDTIKRILEEGAPPGYQRQETPRRPVLGPFIPIIEQILKHDKEGVPRKQRHTAKRLWDRLREEYGYRGGYTQVCDYVRAAAQAAQEAFVPLAFAPGTAQVDWGEAVAIENDLVRKVYLFVLTLPFSNARFVAVFPRATLEFFLEGHRRAFVFFQGVARLIIYDNLKSAVVKVKRHHNRLLNKTFETFAGHHLFEPRFCNVGQGHEKGHVENGVKWAQQNLFAPMPRFSNWEEFNQRLAQDCRRRLDQLGQGQERTGRERLEEERPSFLSLPPWPLPLGGKQTWRVSSLCLVQFDTNEYSVPCEFAHQHVRLQADVAQVHIYAPEVIHAQAPLIAVHPRCHRHHQPPIYDPLHYLPLVARKPRTLDDGAPMQQLWEQLPECFTLLRRRLERDQEGSEGTRQFIAVLLLLKDHPLERLSRAVERALQLGIEHPEAIRNLLLCPPEQTPSPLDLSGRAHLAAYVVSQPSLAGYGALVGSGGDA
jgi:transposase